MPNTSTKGTKGTVGIDEFKNRLRMRWRHEGKRYTFYIGLPASKINYQVAKKKALEIEQILFLEILIQP